MSTVRQMAQSDSANVAVQKSNSRRFNGYPLLGLGITLLLAVLVYGGIYVLTK